jgi:hypothetical protein
MARYLEFPDLYLLRVCISLASLMTVNGEGNLYIYVHKILLAGTKAINSALQHSARRFCSSCKIWSIIQESSLPAHISFLLCHETTYCYKLWASTSPYGSGFVVSTAFSAFQINSYGHNPLCANLSRTGFGTYTVMRAY